MKRLLLVLALVIHATAAIAQNDPEETSVRDVLESEEAVKGILEQRKAEGGVLDMSTPLSSLLLLKEALEREDYEYAGKFLDMRYLPKELEGYDAVELLRALRYVWSRQELLDITEISDDPEGRKNDGLPEYRDQIGRVELRSGTVPIYMQRVPDGEGGRAWKFSNATVARIPEMWDELGYGPVAVYFSHLLPEFRWLGMDNWQVLGVLAALILMWPLASLICLVLAKLLVHRAGPFNDAIAGFLKFQFRVFLYVLLLRAAMNQIGLTVYSMVLLKSGGLIYIGAAVLLLGVINLLHGYQTRRLVQAGSEHYVALLRPVATVTKILILIIIGLVWADAAGYDMSTVVAGLGVGSLAVALAAQKTLENVIGAITIYSARPIKPGDFCRFGTTVGTVEEIGLRSTMIRTLNRTLVSIPNAVFAADEVENFSERDRIRYFRNLRLGIADADQLRALVPELRALFEGHEMVQQDTISVRFDEITDNTANVRIDAGINTNDFQVYLEVAEELNLRIISTVHAHGARFSGPGQSLTLDSGKFASHEPDHALELFLASPSEPLTD